MTPDEFSKSMKELASEMSTKHLRNAFRNTMGQEARRVAKVAKQNLMSSAFKKTTAAARRDIAKGIRGEARKDFSGFIVKSTTSRKTGKGMHRNRYGRLKPVIIWGELGTDVRTNGRTKRSTGQIIGARFMDAARRTEIPAVESRIKATFYQHLQKIASKYGYK